MLRYELCAALCTVPPCVVFKFFHEIVSNLRRGGGKENCHCLLMFNISFEDNLKHGQGLDKKKKLKKYH